MKQGKTVPRPKKNMFNFNLLSEYLSTFLMALEHAEEKQLQHRGQLDCTYQFTSLHYKLQIVSFNYSAWYITASFPPIKPLLFCQMIKLDSNSQSVTCGTAPKNNGLNKPTKNMSLHWDNLPNIPSKEVRIKRHIIKHVFGTWRAFVFPSMFSSLDMTGTQLLQLLAEPRWKMWVPALSCHSHLFRGVWNDQTLLNKNVEKCGWSSQVKLET